MAKRHSDAIAIQLGACNPSGIAHSIIAACTEARAEGAGTAALCADPAIRLMVHQLAFLTNVAEINESLDAYGELTKACELAINVSAAKEVTPDAGMVAICAGSLQGKPNTP
jgi:hypothetical protein